MNYTPDPNFYVIGGNVHAGNSEAYIPRQADKELLDACHRGRYTYVLMARQAGKSSLRIATTNQLVVDEEIDYAVANLDISTMKAYREADHWFRRLISLIDEELGLDTDLSSWWAEHANKPNGERFTTYFTQVVLPQKRESRLVIFIDEVDATKPLAFSDEFFTAIKWLNDARPTNQDLYRLTFVLLGVATPTELIKHSASIPFNVNQRVELIDFSVEEIQPLGQGLGLPPDECRDALFRIHRWTGGHPFLTQQLCQAVARQPERCGSAEFIDRIARETFLGDRAYQNNNLQYVRGCLTYEHVEVGVVYLYRDVRRGKRIKYDPTSAFQAQLKLSGVVKVQNNRLAIRNPIYQTVFDNAWLLQQPALTNSQPYRWPALWWMALCVLLVGGIIWGVAARTIVQPPTGTQMAIATLVVTETATSSPAPPTPSPTYSPPLTSTLVPTAPAQGETGLIFDNLPDEFSVHAIGIQQGYGTDNLEDVDAYGNEFTRQGVVVSPKHPTQPIVLVLTAYEPVKWMVDRSKAAQIAGVIVSGHHEQTIIIDPSIPFAQSTHLEEVFRPFHALSEESEEFREMNTVVEQLVGRKIERFYSAPEEDGNFHIESSPTVVQLSGQDGLDALVDDGKLRLATQADIDAWIDKASEVYSRFNPDLRVSSYMRQGGTYVILDELTLPSDLFGGNSRRFIILEDVPFPDGPLGHNDFYIMDGTACEPMTDDIFCTGTPTFVEPEPIVPTDLFEELPDDFVVYGIGANDGFRIDSCIQYDETAEIGYAEVVVNHPDQPVVLVLTAYDPIVWQVAPMEATEIAAVIVSGYHNQRLRLDDETIPVEISTYDQGGAFPYFLAYEVSPELLEMNERVEQLVGREINFFENQSTDGRFYIGTPPADESSLPVAYEPLPDKVCRSADWDHLNPLIAEGKLDFATQSDIQAWVDKANEVGTDTADMFFRDAYVVREQFTFPYGLSGAHSRSFIIPEGVPFPDGELGHNTFYMMDGTACGAGVRDNPFCDR